MGIGNRWKHCREPMQEELVVRHPGRPRASVARQHTSATPPDRPLVRSMPDER